MNHHCKKRVTGKSLRNRVLCLGTFPPHSSCFHLEDFPRFSLEIFQGFHWFSNASSNQNPLEGSLEQVTAFIPSFLT